MGKTDETAKRPTQVKFKLLSNKKGVAKIKSTIQGTEGDLVQMMAAIIEQDGPFRELLEKAMIHNITEKLSSMS